MKLHFTSDRSSLTEGEIIELSWSVPNCDSLTLTLDNGFKSQVLPLTDYSGSKKFRLHRSQGRTKITLSATSAGKTATKTLKIRVKKMKVTPSETIYQERPHRNPFRRQRSHNTKAGQWADNQKNRFSYLWSLLTPQKKMAYTLLLIMTLGLLLSLTSPRLTFLTNTAILVYLAYILIKR